jgi:ATP-dependent exoDNAse (exonuclease V) beta subunit (contains helicase and exonuclease domains)
MVRPLTVYKASAGSGKTFTLATEYIRLLVENPQSYRHILAVTFTNKATEEMKRRILSQLYGIWQHLPESDRYLEVVRTKTGLTEETIRERAGLALHQLIYNYTDFRVMTIDTFFQGVLRNLARELDLTANLRIGLNDVQVEEMAVDQMIEHLKTTDVLLQWLDGLVFMENISDDRTSECHRTDQEVRTDHLQGRLQGGEC